MSRLRSVKHTVALPHRRSRGGSEFGATLTTPCPTEIGRASVAPLSGTYRRLQRRLGRGRPGTPPRLALVVVAVNKARPIAGLVHPLSHRRLGAHQDCLADARRVLQAGRHPDISFSFHNEPELMLQSSLGSPRIHHQMLGSWGDTHLPVLDHRCPPASTTPRMSPHHQPPPQTPSPDLPLARSWTVRCIPTPGQPASPRGDHDVATLSGGRRVPA